MVITPSTKLDAVNEILSAIGASPVSTLEDNLNVDVLNAIRILDSVDKEIQSKGWDFNRQDNTLLSPDLSGKIACPVNYLTFYASGYKLTRKSGYFFDYTTKTDKFPEGLTVNIVEQVPFEELPEPFRKYITAKSSRLFNMKHFSDDFIDAHLQIEESAAYAEVLDYDLTTGNYNIFNDDTTISQNIQRS